MRNVRQDRKKEAGSPKLRYFYLQRAIRKRVPENRKVQDSLPFRVVSVENKWVNEDGKLYNRIRLRS
jgi:hypothetical protein